MSDEKHSFGKKVDGWVDDKGRWRTDDEKNRFELSDTIPSTPQPGYTLYYITGDGDHAQIPTDVMAQAAKIARLETVIAKIKAATEQGGNYKLATIEQIIEEYEATDTD